MHLSTKDLPMEEKESDLCKDDLMLTNKATNSQNNYNAVIEQFFCSFDESDLDEEPIDNTQD